MAKADSKSRRKQPAWSVALLLAFAVSFWGLHYKLSLYHPPSAMHARGPAAKLLSQRERPVVSSQLEFTCTADKPLLPEHHPILADAAALAFTGMHGVQPGRIRLVEPKTELRRLPVRALRQSAPRPPPTFA